ncbi:hypothetical protein [Zophobihabitans entericus]|uniref:hypothetical protein n=1 Tax=Zophobihabitans entericus TaxID=1635327 RepID=UPI001AAE72A2|nr:hypothetical protein [Zophobihabitans entericus]
MKTDNESIYLDDDEDLFDSISGLVTSQWYYISNGETIAFTPTLNDTFCSLAENGKPAPYIVTLSNDGALSLNSQFGLPRSTTYEHVTKTYIISPSVSICYVQPNLGNTHYSSHSNTQWTADKGFFPQTSGKNFPTTAFDQARFDLVTTHTDYIWQVTQGQSIIQTDSSGYLPVSQGKVSVIFKGANKTQPTIPPYNQLGSGYPVTIIGTLENAPSITYQFTIEKWFINNGNSVDDYTQAQSFCRSLNTDYRIPSLIELTNSVQAGGSSTGNSYTRKIDESLLAEWGALFDPNVDSGQAEAMGTGYVGSDWVNNFYWTNEEYTITAQYTVNSALGSVSNSTSSFPRRTACIYP